MIASTELIVAPLTRLVSLAEALILGLMGVDRLLQALLIGEAVGLVELPFRLAVVPLREGDHTVAGDGVPDRLLPAGEDVNQDHRVGVFAADALRLPRRARCPRAGC